MMKIAEQKTVFESGNGLAALAAKQINYHVMGYYPITPSTQIAEYLDEMKAGGAHGISLIPAEGEHSAAGICYGAAAGGGRVFNATSANGLLYALEQLVKQAGGEICGRMAILAEGDATERPDLIYLEKLPLFDAEGNPIA